MTKISKPITPDDTEAVDKQIAADFGVLRFVEPAQIVLVGLGLTTFLWGGLILGGITTLLVCVGLGLIIFAAVLTPLTVTFRKQAKKAYKTFFEQYEFRTPGGEEVVFVSSNHTGTHLEVRFQDGYEAEYPLYRLSNEGGQRHEWARFKHDFFGNHLTNLSKVNWRTSEGKIGVVRDVDFPKNRDIKLLLKLDDGQIAEFDLGSLEPISASAVPLTKPDASAQ